jgi:CUE domain
MKSVALPPTESTDWATAQEDPSDSTEEVAHLKIKYANQLKLLRDIFPDWTAEDLVFALQEVDGDSALATVRIAGGRPPPSLNGLIIFVGHATQWGQVKKKSLKDKPKTTGRPEGAPIGTRGRGRGASDRGAERGTRGRGGIHISQLEANFF